MDCEPLDPPPTDEEKSQLKRLTGGIIRVQGNRFIKELLRARGITIGRNKAEFEANLLAAIDRGCLGLDDVRSWLGSVEGWGNQHVYLYGISDALRSKLTVTRVKNAVKRAGWEDKWDAETVMDFPDLPQLTSISFDGNVLRVVWQEGTQNWTPDGDKNYQKEEGLDLYEYRAFRQIEDRVITRFVVHLDRGLAALLLPQPIRGQEHTTAIDEAKQVIKALMSLKALEDEQLDLSIVARNMDQESFKTAGDPEAFIRPQKSRLRAGASYVEFGARSEKKAYAAEEAIRNVRDSIETPAEQKKFKSDVGVFLLGPGKGLERRIRAELHRSGHRIRFKAQMDAAEVWLILSEIAEHKGAA